MQSAAKILVLSGTREGVEVIQRLQEKQVYVIASVAGDARTRVTFTSPRSFWWVCHTDRFSRISLSKMKSHMCWMQVIQTIHRYRFKPNSGAAHLMWNFLNITRSGWRAGAGDMWHTVAREADVA